MTTKVIHFIIFFFAIAVSYSLARTLNVGTEQPYQNLRAAAYDAKPGDTILIHQGTYLGGEYVNDLKGEKDSWITIIAIENVLFDGGTEAIHLTNAQYIKLKGLKFKNQTGNGVNIDDGGDYSTPSHNIIIEDCHWLGMNASGNNDELKLSGVDDFIIRNCIFAFGAGGGSLIDMVGCHNGIIEDCYFEFAGSNAIQAKGASKEIIVRRNFFRDCGLRAINIGGSTGSQYFRPLDANYEASDIFIHSNIFVGSQAPIAFVGVINSYVVHNTIIHPEKWAIRILQENNSDNIAKCSNNSFINNIVFIDNRASNPTINIGPNTLPETFSFRNNLWFNSANPNWSGPNLPVIESDGLYKTDPLFKDFANGDFELEENSPAIAAGYTLPFRLTDKSGNFFAKSPTIGAYEANPPSSVREFNHQIDKSIFQIRISENALIISSQKPMSDINVDIVNIEGKKVLSQQFSTQNNDFQIPFSNRLSAGLYIVIVEEVNKTRLMYLAIVE